MMEPRWNPVRTRLTGCSDQSVHDRSPHPGATDQIPRDRIADGVDQTSPFLNGKGHGLLRRPVMWISTPIFRKPRVVCQAWISTKPNAIQARKPSKAGAVPPGFASAINDRWNISFDRTANAYLAQAVFGEPDRSKHHPWPA